MKCSTTIFAACAVLFSLLCPQVAPSPMIKVEGRDLVSRFVPPVHPIFPRGYSESEPKLPTPARDPVTPVKRHHHAPDPTASNFIYRSEPYAFAHDHYKYEKDWKKKLSGKKI